MTKKKIKAAQAQLAELHKFSRSMHRQAEVQEKLAHSAFWEWYGYEKALRELGLAPEGEQLIVVEDRHGKLVPR